MLYMAANSKVDDEAFTEVVAGSRSWRQVLRDTGSKMSGSNAVRARAARLGLDTSHFSGQRKWSDAQLKEAVANASSWNEVALTLRATAVSAKRRAMRLGLEYGHLDRRQQAGLRSLPVEMVARNERLRFAGEAIATAWLQMAGCAVAAVPGQSPYDLVAEFPDGALRKVQVKTSRDRKKGERSKQFVPRFSLTSFIYVSALERANLPYSSDQVDYFFLVGSMSEMWLVPHERLTGQTSCSPGPEYEEFRVVWPEPSMLS